MKRFVAVLCALLSVAGSPVWAADRDDDPHGAVFNIAHFDVMPMATGGVDFLQSGYTLLFKYRSQSKADPGLLSFRILDLIPPTTNHSEIVQVWDSYRHYLQHLSQSHTITFRFDVQGSARLGGLCCVGSPIDDRQYTPVQSFGAPWTSSAVPSTAGPAGAVFVISYVEFLPGGDLKKNQEELLHHGEETHHANTPGNVTYTILQELHRQNRYVVLEVWTDHQRYQQWLGADATRDFLARLRPLLGSPIDHRLTILCGDTFVDGQGCTSP
ncbi:MAG TPA: antibiotic biosynthesis monooxygenase [Steroidobacteraceae bacterium]|jgi:quinol monooxygenase YgiN|nr:antibiotic biosynthesis monooxygenase [Steroidobacteraceae bacterium]